MRISWFTTAWSNGYQTPDKCSVPIAQSPMEMDAQKEVGGGRRQSAREHKKGERDTGRERE